MNKSKTSSISAYLESYNTIHLHIPEYYKVDSVCIIDNDDITLSINNKFSNEKLIVIETSKVLSLREEYYLKINNEIKCLVCIGNITTTNQFDELNYFDDWLGYKYHKEFVTFRLWAPVSKVVYLIINDNDKYLMNYLDKGVYEITVDNPNELLDGLSYHYLIKNDSEFIKVLDPYAISVNSDLSKCFIIDINKTYQYKNKLILNNFNKDDSIIYELHVRDFTISLPLKHRGLYLGICESANLDNHGLNYLDKLGITHIQMAPVNAFGGVDYNIQDGYHPNFKYNWGYNPVLYNALCGWYSSNPNDPYQTINDFKQMVDSIHEKGIGVILDVVYNHVYIKEEYCLNLIVPKYPFRFFDTGEYSNASWCGNDIATERKMNQKFILDSLMFYQNIYKIDGFRFDLMGLIDTDTINKASALLNNINPNILLYGEGWHMPTAYPPSLLAHMYNSENVNNVGFFNDYFRNTIKGKHSHNQNSILISGNHSKELLDGLFSGNKVFNSYLQSINYVECHDNTTFYDEQIKYGINSQELKENAKLALIFVLFSKGISFIHSGQELMRSKQGIDNTYNLPDVINKFPWNLSIINQDLLNEVTKLINIKKEEKFSEYKYSKIIQKDRYTKIIFEKDEAKFNLYLNLKKETATVDIQNEILLYCNSKKVLDKYLLVKDVIITKTIK